MTIRLLAMVVALAPWWIPRASADEVALAPSQDNTLYEDPTGSLSNGAGPVMFTGNNGQDLARRALLRFDVRAAVPAGAHIDSVALTLYVSNAPNTTPRKCELHRALETWGEGSSSTTSGSGAPATAGDATWIHTQWPDGFWGTAGGSFAATPSASQDIAGEGFYGWTDAGMASDVQTWLDDPSLNHGWLIRGEEAVLNTARRFDSRENPVAGQRPRLTIRYSTPVGVAGREPTEEIRLSPCRPNPASGETRVAFRTPRRVVARLEVVDMAGRRIATLIDAPVEPGQAELVWEGTDSRGVPVAPGVYSLRLLVDGSAAAATRVVIVR